jgi:hypothetical protein
MEAPPKLKPLKKIGLLHYYICPFGNIYNTRGKQLKPDTSNEYKRIWLYNNGIAKKYFVHVLVCMHFCRGYKEENIVNHKDHNKHNNHYKNLESITQSENIKKYFQFKRRKNGIIKGSI